MPPESLQNLLQAALQRPQASRPTFTAGLDQARLQIQQLIAEGCSGSVLQARIADLAIQYEVVASTLLKIADSLISEDDAAIDADAELQQIHYDAKLLEDRQAFTLEDFLPACLH